MTMQKVKSYVFVAAMAASAASCGSVVRDGRSPVYMVIEQLSGSRGASTPGPYGGTLLSDVVTNVTTGGACSTTNPCPTIFNDLGRVTLRMQPKDIGAVTTPAPSPNNEITVTRYRVTYRRVGRPEHARCRRALCVRRRGDRDDSIGRIADARLRAGASYRQGGTAACAAGRRIRRSSPRSRRSASLGAIRSETRSR